MRPVRGGLSGRAFRLALVFQQERQEPLCGLLLSRGTVICRDPSIRGFVIRGRVLVTRGW